MCLVDRNSAPALKKNDFFFSYLKCMRKGSKRGPFISFLLERRRKNELNLFGVKEQEEEDEKKSVFFRDSVFPLN